MVQWIAMSRCHVIVGETVLRRALEIAAIYSSADWCEVPPPLTVTSIPTAGGHGTVVHRLRWHAQLGGRVPPGLGRGLLPRGRASHFVLSSAPAVATTDRMEGLGAHREALARGEGLRVGNGHAFLGVRHGNGAHTQVLAFNCYILTCPKTETEEARDRGKRGQGNRYINVNIKRSKMYEIPY